MLLRLQVRLVGVAWQKLGVGCASPLCIALGHAVLLVHSYRLQSRPQLASIDLGNWPAGAVSGSSWTTTA